MANIFKAKTLVSRTGIFSHEAIAPNLVYNTGDQNIGGTKTFANNLEVQGTGIFNALDLSNISEFNFSGTNINLINGNVNISGGTLYISGNAVLTGVNLNAYATTANLFTTGSTLDNKINALSGYVSGISANGLLPNTIVYITGNQTISGIKTFATGVNIRGNVGIGIDSNNNFDLYVRKSPAGVTVNPDSDSIAVFEGSGNSHITVLASNAQTAGVVLGSPADNFGSYLSWNHDNNELKLATASPGGYIQLLTNTETQAVRITSGGNVGVGMTSPSEKLEVAGNILANNLVYNTGNQSISGVKTFDVFPIVSGNKLITGVDLNSYATVDNLFATGSTLDNKINALSGYVSGISAGGTLPNSIVYTTGDQLISGNKTFLNNVNISGTGNFNNVKVSNIDKLFLSGIDIVITGNSSINVYNAIYISGNPVLTGIIPTTQTITNVVYTTGDQTISGIKTFDLFPIVSGNKLITGVDLSSYSTNANLFATGSTLNNKIDSLSGYVDSKSTTLPSTIVYTTGNQTIAGNKIFVDNTIFGQPSQDDFLVISGNNFTLYGTGNFTSGVLAPNLVYNTGNQTIDGTKTFNFAPIVSGNRLITGVDLSSYATNANLFLTGSGLQTQVNTLTTNLLLTGSGLQTQVNTLTTNLLLTGSGLQTQVNTLTTNLLLTGSGLQTQVNTLTTNLFLTGSGLQTQVNTLTRNLLLTGSGLQTQVNTLTRNLLLTGSRLDSKINALSGYVDSKPTNLPSTIVYTTGNQKIFGNKNFADNVIVGDETQDNLIIISGNKITFSIYPTVNGTGIVYDQGDQNISGIKTFASRPTVNGTGVLLIGEASSVTLPNTIVYTTGNQLISGNKTFLNNINVSGTGNFTNVKVSNIDKLFLSGIDIVVTGNSSINVYNAIYISGNPVLTGIISTAQTITDVVYTTGNQTINGNKTFRNSGIFSLSDAISLGLPNNPLSVVGSGNSYVQLNIQNRATGTTATADLVITANNGTDTTNYINLGINNSGYNDPTFSNGSGLDGYLFINGGSLDIGTQTPNTSIEFHAGGTTASKVIARISESGLNLVSGNLTVKNTAVLLSGQNSFIINLFNQAGTQAAGHNYFGNLSMLFSSDLTQRRFPVLESCVVRKASWSQANTTLGNPSLNSTGYFINTSSNPPQTGIISTVINTQSTLTPTHYTADFSPPITILNGDYIVCSLFGPTYATTPPGGQRNSVNLYCYN